MHKLIAAPFTPMNQDGSLNLDLIPSYYTMLKANAVSGAFICGSTGEGASLSFSEKRRVIEAWALCTRNDTNFKTIALVGGTSVEECRELATHSASCGINAVAFTSPFYLKPANASVLATCCATVAAATPDTPFYYYHIPVLTGVNIPMYDLLQQVDGYIPNFAGIKYTHEDMMDYLSCLHFKNGKYEVLWGRDECILAALSLGASASVGSTFNYAAPLYHRLANCFENGDWEEARALQIKSIEIVRVLGKYGGIATGKLFMKAIGLDCGQFRLPAQNIPAEMEPLFCSDLDRIQFIQNASHLPNKTA